MWIYSQKSGELLHGAAVLGVGYSGFGDSKNHPADQCLKNRGPIPRGQYTIQSPHDTGAHGPYVMALEPHPENEMFGRGGFLIHGDSVKKPGTASQGCIILPLATRKFIWNSGDHQLQVVE